MKSKCYQGLSHTRLRRFPHIGCAARFRCMQARMIKEDHGRAVLDALEIVDFLDQVSVTVHEEPDALSHYLLC